MANTDKEMVIHIENINRKTFEEVTISTSSEPISNLYLASALSNSKPKLSRNNSSTFSSKSHFSLRSNALLSKASNNESLSNSMNPLSLKRTVNNNSTPPINLNVIDFTVITSTNPQGRSLGTFDTISNGSHSNRSIYSFNRIASLSNNNNSNANNANTRPSIESDDFINDLVETRDPVIIRGAGNVTIFGVSNKFNETFPSQLYAKLAPEEFRDTIKQINSILATELANSFRWLVFGSVFCCCTLGCSLFPVIFMNKKARLSINKFLSIENQRIYLKLGLKWRLAKIKCNSNSLMEYVLLIDFLPTVRLYHPD